jgi:hypothetical protein
MERGESEAGAIRQYLFDKGFTGSQGTPISKEGIRILRQYVEQTLKVGKPNLEALSKARKSPHYNQNVERVLDGINYFISHSNSQLPGKSSRENNLFQIPTEILYYLQLVRESYHGEIIPSEIMEELAVGFKDARRSPSFKVRTPEERLKYPDEDPIIDLPGEPITLERIASTVKKDLGYSLVHDYLVNPEKFNANYYAIERGFKSSAEMFRALDNKHKTKFKKAVKKVYEAKTRAGEKVNVSDLCFRAGISTSTFYRFIQEKEGSMKKFKEKIYGPEETKEKPRIIKMNQRKQIKRKVAAAALIGLSVIAPQIIKSDKSLPAAAQTSTTRVEQQPLEEKLELASL